MKSEVNATDAKVYAALEAFSRAATWEEYNAAKRLAGKCDRVSQAAMVDTIKEARTRVTQLEKNAGTNGGQNAR